MIKLVLIRHGQSVWNLENKFTGWTDVDLSKNGLQEAREAGKVLKKNEYTFDIAYTSVLKRSIRTLWIVLHQMDFMWIPCIQILEVERTTLRGSSRLKQRRNRKKIWRRASAFVEKVDERTPSCFKDNRYSL